MSSQTQYFCIWRSWLLEKWLLFLVIVMLFLFLPLYILNWAKQIKLLFIITFSPWQLAGASPELISRLIPEHIRRQAGLNLTSPHPAGTWWFPSNRYPVLVDGIVAKDKAFGLVLSGIRPRLVVFYAPLRVHRRLWLAALLVVSCNWLALWLLYICFVRKS